MGRKRHVSPCGVIPVCLGEGSQTDSSGKPTESTSLLAESAPEDLHQKTESSETTITSDTCSKMRQWWHGISLPTYVFVCMFGLSSWIDINGLFVELPLLVEQLPESWSLPSYLAMIIQIANVGPLIYTVLHSLWPHRVKEWPVVYLIIITGAASCLLLAFLWDRTLTTPDGVQHSVVLFILVGCLALVDCTSSVVYLPYMAAFKPLYLTALYIGEGCSGLVPGIAGLIQGIGGSTTCLNISTINTTTNRTMYELVPASPEPLFSVEAFFFMLFGLMCVSGLSFTLLHFLPLCNKEKVASVKCDDVSPEVKTMEEQTSLRSHHDSASTDKSSNKTPSANAADNKSSEHLMKPEVNGVPGAINTRKVMQGKQPDYADSGTVISMMCTMSQPVFVYLLVLTCIINAITNGALPSVQSYSALPYGSTAYMLAVRLSTVANPLACFIALFLPCSSVITVSTLTALGLCMSGYQMYLAGTSPTPPLQGQDLGTALVVVSAVMLIGIFSYTKVIIASMLRESGGRRALLWCGVATQLGSLLGAVTSFLLVSVFQVFVSAPQCPA